MVDGHAPHSSCGQVEFAHQLADGVEADVDGRDRPTFGGPERGLSLAALGSGSSVEP